MADIRFIGKAPLVAQVDTFTPGGTIEVGDIFILTITGADGSVESITFAASATTAANVAAGLVALWNAATGPLMSAITASGTVTVILTADTAGNAFEVVGTTTEANGDAADNQTFVRVATTANSGPSDVRNTANWSGGVLPGAVAGNNVYIEDATILYGLDLSGTAETLASLNVLRSQIGSNPAAGFLPIYLQVKSTIGNIAKLVGPGTSTESTPININFGATASTITIFDSGDNSNAYDPAIRILCNSASTVLHLRKGKVGIALGNGETATMGTINQNYDTEQESDTELYLGAGVTLTTLNKVGGKGIINCGATTITNNGGDLRTEGSGAIVTLTASKGEIVSNSTGTITNLNAIGESIIDFTKSSAARTVTTPKVGDSGKIKHNSATTLTAQIARYEASGNLETSAAAA
jgi:hypothetical protein